MRLDAPHPAEFDPARRVIVWPGDIDVAFKDPVIHRGPNGWRAWICEHRIDDPARADAMTTRYATSADGLDWNFGGTALAPNGNGWDSRGTRIAAVVEDGDGWLAYHDGRANSVENWEERTGVASGAGPAAFTTASCGPVGQPPHGSRSVRYVDAVTLPGGGRRWYYEAAGPDGAHNLLTEYAPRPD